MRADEADLTQEQIRTARHAYYAAISYADELCGSSERVHGDRARSAELDEVQQRHDGPDQHYRSWAGSGVIRRQSRRSELVRAAANGA